MELCCFGMESLPGMPELLIRLNRCELRTLERAIDTFTTRIPDGLRLAVYVGTAVLL